MSGSELILSAPTSNYDFGARGTFRSSLRVRFIMHNTQAPYPRSHNNYYSSLMSSGEKIHSMLEFYLFLLDRTKLIHNQALCRLLDALSLLRLHSAQPK
jgi:hypothetical protein